MLHKVYFAIRMYLKHYIKKHNFVCALHLSVVTCPTNRLYPLITLLGIPVQSNTTYLYNFYEAHTFSVSVDTVRHVMFIPIHMHEGCKIL